MIDQASIILNPSQHIRITLYLGSGRNLLQHNVTVTSNLSDASESLHSDLLVRFLKQPIRVDERLDASIRAYNGDITA